MTGDVYYSPYAATLLKFRDRQHKIDPDEVEQLRAKVIELTAEVTELKAALWSTLSLRVAYIELHPGSPQTIKQHLAAIKMLFDYLVISQIVPAGP